METIKTPAWKRLYFETHPSEILPATTPEIIPPSSVTRKHNFWFFATIGAGLIILAAFIIQDQKREKKRAAGEIR